MLGVAVGSVGAGDQVGLLGQHVGLPLAHFLWECFLKLRCERERDVSEETELLL